MDYSAVECKALATAYGLKANRLLILGYPVKILTDHHPLVWRFSNKEPNGHMARLQMAIADHEVEISYIVGRDNVVAEALLRIRQAENCVNAI